MKEVQWFKGQTPKVERGVQSCDQLVGYTNFVKC